MIETPKSTPPSRTPPVREDCWTEDATWILVRAWGARFVELNRGNLRQKDWQSVADAVNAVHGHDVKTRRTDVQCKNRIDTLKKKYKAEKARVSDSPGGGYVSTWPFYNRMDELIGSIVAAKKPSPPPSASVSVSPPMGIPLLPYRKPVAAVAQPLAVLPQKRPAPSPAPVVDDSYFRRNYSAVAAAAAAEVEDEDDLENSDSDSEEEIEEASDGDGMRRLARAIERLGEMYERVEAEKQKQMIELEKQRMQFTKDMEVQRMQLFMDTQVQLERIKRAKRSGSNDFCS